MRRNSDKKLIWNEQKVDYKLKYEALPLGFESHMTCFNQLGR